MIEINHHQSKIKNKFIVLKDKVHLKKTRIKNFLLILVDLLEIIYQLKIITKYQILFLVLDQKYFINQYLLFGLYSNQ
jgi:hypothetical protein